jgi:CubicO group peptidase (beta-lactamase class C family)
MKTKGLLILLIILIGGFIYFFQVLAPIIAGFGAKDLCSCAFIGERSETDVLENELGRFPLALGTFKLNRKDSSAVGSVFGFSNVKAIYRKGLGCTLLRDKTEEELRADLSSIEIEEVNVSDTIAWPIGSKVQTSIQDGVNRKLLVQAIDDAFLDTDSDHPKKTRAVVVVRNGEIIAEKYAEGFDAFTPQIGWSMSKSITNTMIGVLVKKRGFDIYQPAPIPEWREADDPRNKITTDHLLRMSSGLDWIENYKTSCPATKMLYNSSNMGLYASLFEAEEEVDTKWYYSSGTSNILSRILRIELGEDYLEWPFKEIFYKTGVKSALFEVDASNAFIGSSYIWASPRDWARLGLLYLNDGVWNDERILPEGWVEYSKTPTPPSEMLQYGAQFWLNVGDADDASKRRLPDCPRDVYSMNGYEGQRVFILPTQNMVVVRMGQTRKEDFDMNEFLASIIKSVN